MQSVRNTRREYQDVMREEFNAEVERLTGRKVVAFPFMLEAQLQ